jgi:phosphatidylinositol alpha-1,6-mannosyltransferase
VIGSGDDERYLRHLAFEQGVNDRVHLLGHVPYADLPSWYAACDVFAMPNRDIDGDTEGFGLVFLEAASAGKPAIGGTAGGTGSAIVDGMTGLRVDGESVDAVADGLERTLRDPQTARRMGANARQRVLDNFTHQRRVDQLRALALRGRYPGAVASVPVNPSPTG